MSQDTDDIIHGMEAQLGRKMTDDEIKLINALDLDDESKDLDFTRTIETLKSCKAIDGETVDQEYIDKFTSIAQEIKAALIYAGMVPLPIHDTQGDIGRRFVQYKKN